MFLFNSRNNPSLPQNDTPAEQKKRAEQLAQAQKAYVWTNDSPNVKGVPMSLTVPADDKPTIAWFIKIIDVVLEIVENTIANAVGDLDGNLADLKSIQSHLQKVKQAHKNYSNKNPLAFIEQELANIKLLFIGDIYKVIEDFDRIKKILNEKYVSKTLMAPSGLAAYQDLFNTIKLNPVAEAFQNDSVFAYLRVAGPNAMLIQNISVMPANFPVTEAGYQSVMGSGDSLQKALADKRLFLLDYKELQALVDNPGVYNGVTKQLFAPLALFARAAGGNDLVAVAIQRTQTADAQAIVYATKDTGSASYWSWQTAKSIVQMADGNYHELFVHLGRTHLLIEAFTLATHRSLSTSHPVNVLLLPHFEGTLFINNAAAGSLIAAGGPIDDIFAGVITQSQASAGADRLGYDFYDNMLPNDLKLRGVNDATILPVYPYRDDALLVWNAIQQWVTDYINIYYVNDAAVVGDTELAAWSAELVNAGKVKGFTSVVTKNQLVQVLTMIIFTGSAQHAAVNFPQSSIMTYAPAISGAIWGGKNPSGATKQDWLNTLAPIGLASKQLDLLHLLGGVYYRMLGNYQSNNFPYPEWFGDKKVIGKGNALDKFQQSLKVVEAEINQRNAQRKIPYTYLLPSKIPMSINI